MWWSEMHAPQGLREMGGKSFKYLCELPRAACWLKKRGKPRVESLSTSPEPDPKSASRARPKNSIRHTCRPSTCKPSLHHHNNLILRHLQKCRSAKLAAAVLYISIKCSKNARQDRADMRVKAVKTDLTAGRRLTVAREC